MAAQKLSGLEMAVEFNILLKNPFNKYISTKLLNNYLWSSASSVEYNEYNFLQKRWINESFWIKWEKPEGANGTHPPYAVSEWVWWNAKANTLVTQQSAEK